MAHDCLFIINVIIRLVLNSQSASTQSTNAVSNERQPVVLVLMSNQKRHLKYSFIIGRKETVLESVHDVEKQSSLTMELPDSTVAGVK